MPVPPEGDKSSKKRVCERVRLATGDMGVLLFADDMVIMAESKEGGLQVPVSLSASRFQSAFLKIACIDHPTSFEHHLNVVQLF